MAHKVTYALCAIYCFPLLVILPAVGDLIWPQRAAKSVMGSTLSSILHSAGAADWPITGQGLGY